VLSLKKLFTKETPIVLIAKSPRTFAVSFIATKVALLAFNIFLSSPNFLAVAAAALPARPPSYSSRPNCLIFS